MAEDFNNAESFVDQVKEYVNTRLAQLKLSFAEKTSKIVALMIAILLSALVFFLVVVLLSIAASIAIGQWLENLWLGFLIMGAVIFLVGVVLWISKDRWLRIPIMNAMIEAIFDKDEDDEKD